MNRAGLQDLCSIRLKEIRLLIKNKNYDAAYYLSGYVIEYALKSCIAKKVAQYDFPDLRKAFTHSFNELIKTAGLGVNLANELRTNSVFQVMWKVVNDWKPESRYATHKRGKVVDMYKAITNKTNGVLRWIQQYW